MGSLEEQFKADCEALDEQFRQFYTPEMAESIRRCVEGEYDPPDAAWRNPVQNTPTPQEKEK